MNEVVASLKAELLQITKSMDLPEYRRRNVRWLNKKISLRNSEHQQIDRAKEIIEQLLQHGIGEI